MGQHHIIEAQSLSVGYKEGRHTTEVLSDLTFTLRAGELTCFLGVNGAGKSTLLRTLAGAQPALGGELTLMGVPLQQLSARALSKRIGVVLTDKPQAGGLTVRELVALGRQPHTGFFGRLGSHDRKLIRQAMESVGIAHKAASYTAHLSDGERQKVMIAKALVQECPLILLDEPTAFLDVASRIEIMTLLHRLAYDEGKAILLTTHDIEQTLQLADRLWLLTPGRRLLCGTTEDMVLRGDMEQLFAGKQVAFDRRLGIFYPISRGGKRVRLVTEDDILRHWAQNALARKGYDCVEGEAPVTIELLTADRLQYTSSTTSKSYGSFEALLDDL